VLGAGRMGQQLLGVLDDAQDCELSGVWRRHDDLGALLTDADIAIDFTLPEANAAILAAMVRAKKPLVCGVTGLGGAQMQCLEQAARSIPLLFDRNMSLGMAVMMRLVGTARTLLGADFTDAVSETHHVHKQDSPSGTALKLAEAISGADGRDPADVTIEAKREGEVIGAHRVEFSSVAESLQICHSVAERRVFAAGALNAARWLVARPSGLYSMQDLARRHT